MIKHLITFLAILITSGGLLFFLNTFFYPVPEKIQNNVARYWFQQAYFRNEVYLYFDKMKDEKLLPKLQYNSSDLKTANNVTALEYLNMYNDYINQLGQLSRMILEIDRAGVFIIDDLVYILKNIDLSNIDQNEINTTSKIITEINSLRETIMNQNADLNITKHEIKQEYENFRQSSMKVKNDENSTKKTVESIMAEIPLVVISGKVKHIQKYGLKKPDYLLKPIREFGDNLGELNAKYEYFIDIYNKQRARKETLNTLLNYFIYIISFFGLLLYERQNREKYNKSSEPINYPTGNLLAHFKRYV